MLGLKSALEPSKVKLLNHEIQKKKLLGFEEKGTTNGSVSYSESSGLHDDYVMPPLGPHFEGSFEGFYGALATPYVSPPRGIYGRAGSLGCMFEGEWITGDADTSLRYARGPAGLVIRLRRLKTKD